MFFLFLCLLVTEGVLGVGQAVAPVARAGKVRSRGSHEKLRSCVQDPVGLEAAVCPAGAASDLRRGSRAR